VSPAGPAGPSRTTAPAPRRWVLTEDPPLALAAADLNGCLRRASSRFCSLVGRSEPELRGMPLLRLLHEEDQPAHAQELHALAAGQRPYRRDERYVRPDGTVVWATNEIERSDEPGEPGLLVVAQASTALLARAELARERAEADVRRRDEFLSVLSHELRSPLAAILVWARLLRDSGYEEVDARRGVEVIERSGRSLERILEDLGHVARISSGKLQLTGRCTLDVRSVAQAAADAMLGEANSKGVQLLRSLPQEPVLVNGDPGRLQQAITNVLSNAVKFTPPEGRIELSLVASGNEAVIRVSDTGEGMSESFVPLVFERFRQGDTTTTRSHHGLGLGLYIVRHLVALHGGRVRAASPGPGQGSVFTITLPLEETSAVAAPQEGAPAREAEVRPGLKVLVVDDDDDTREALRLILKQSGLAVETAASAAEALDKVQRLRPEVLLSDIAMPGEDGLALIRRVRSLPADKGGSIPAAALTAYASPAERDSALQAGFDWHVPKPVDPPELLHVIASLASRRSR
jgi:PAS domain S-box-containing protein